MTLYQIICYDDICTIIVIFVDVNWNYTIKQEVNWLTGFDSVLAYAGMSFQNHLSNHILDMQWFACVSYSYKV